MIHRGSFVVLLLLLNSCAIKVKKLNGFTKESSETRQGLFFLSTIAIEKELNSSGWFVTLTHKNGKELSLFVPNTDKSNKLDISNIINEVEFSNNPNDWSFYYCIFGVISIDSIKDATGKKIEYNFYKTIIEQNRPFVQQLKKVKGYTVEYVYKDSASFCRASVEITELNKYNSVIPIQDGRPVNAMPKPPFYVFEEKETIMNILLVKSNLCY